MPCRCAVSHPEYPSPLGGNLTREDYCQPTELILKGKLLVYMLQSQYGITIDNNMHGHCNTNAISQPIEELIDFLNSLNSRYYVGEQSLL